VFESRRARHLFRHPSGRSRQFSNKNEASEPLLGSMDKLVEPPEERLFRAKLRQQEPETDRSDG
jgi:hypothetical protein